MVSSEGKEDGTATASVLLVSSWNSHAAIYFCSRPNRNVSKFTQGTEHSLADASAEVITRKREWKWALSEVHVWRSILELFELGGAGLRYKKSPCLTCHLVPIREWNSRKTCFHTVCHQHEALQLYSLHRMMSLDKHGKDILNISRANWILLKKEKE